MHRRAFMQNSVAGLITGSAAVAAFPKSALADPTGHPAGFPHQDAGDVKEIVTVAHFDFDRVKQIVTARPALAEASWEWGFGDWETALGAASHMGRRDIAEFLIDHGAPPTLFSAAMLGHLSVVRSVVESQPGVQRIPGPHSITLLAHARAGGQNAAAVADYLTNLGDADLKPQAAPLSASEISAFTGAYTYGTREDEQLTVFEKNGSLMIRQGNDAARGLSYHGNGEFHPVGAEAVRIVFVQDGLKAVLLSVYDPHLLVTARRV